MKALVTGGCGFIGSNLVHKLVREGWEIDVVDDMSSGDLDNLAPLRCRVLAGPLAHLYERHLDPTNPQVVVINDDFCTLEIARRIINKDYEIIFHLAANPRVEYTVQNPVKSTEENLFKSVKLMVHCVGNVKRFVMASSAAVYGNPEKNLPTSEWDSANPLSPYGVQKLAAEQFGRVFSTLYELDTVFLRLFNVFGPNQRGNSPYATAVAAWCEKIKEDKPLRSDGDGMQTRDMIYVDDVTEAFLCAAQSKSKFYGSILNIGTGIRISNNEILAILREKFSHIIIHSAPPRPGDARHTQANIERAKTDLGWKPLWSFGEGLEETLEWWNFNE